MQTITSYLERCEQHKQVLFRIKNGSGYYVIDGVEVPQAEYELLNPTPEYNRRNNSSKGENPDKTRVV